jgi:hypothetical protein
LARFSFRMALREAVRKMLYARARMRVLALGDSHVRVFEHWWFLRALPRTRFEIVYVPGATAAGIGNPKSITRARTTFQQALENRAADLVLLNLGEVDTAYTLWKRADTHGKDVHMLMEQAAESYCKFVVEAAAAHPLAVLSASLPTLTDHAQGQDEVSAARASVKASQAERTQLALAFNQRVRACCETNGIPYLNADAAALDTSGTVRPEWINQDRYDHHYARRPYAEWLAVALKQLVHPSGVRLR